MTTIEDLMEVRHTMGRFFQRIENPTKMEHLAFSNASSVLNKAIENMDRLSRSGKRAPQVAEHLQVKEALDSMTIEEIKAEVNSGNMDPRIAMMMEESGRDRGTLMAWLAERLKQRTTAALG